ncbi:uncharacterized protein CIMG_01630 [Coccidioides immitis RS]|uniref:Ribosomal protein YmL11, mitochondrial n=1 Tax=Coccidioides immitis (strain RS) TaxID=246410 RepID=J3KJL5_COCIM|nr:uncharacterized protein CIMG_01630 [Coccidioides immitis RS]EAS36276.3 hypothetical protein CIMG_01630 [Coccidioides immitis RS]TPX25590.1 hypothetical protein DIZ76_011045 [Coccidioides immitis]
MPPRLRLSTCSTISNSLRHECRRQSGAAIAAMALSQSSVTSINHIRGASTASATANPAPLYQQTQPLSHRRPEYRKSQLHRQYTSLLRTMPLILLFQHNNLKSIEWVNIRRELSNALRKVDEDLISKGRTDMPPLADAIKMQTIQTHIFEAALRVVDFFRPGDAAATVDPTAPILSREDPRLTHDLSYTAYQAVLDKRGKHELATLLTGPIAVVSFPYVSPEHVKAALSILAPSPPTFPAPTRRANPGYYEFATQSGLQKLVMLGARVEGKVFDDEGTRWIGGIEGGLGGLRAQLVYLLQSMGANLTNTLEGAGKSLYLTMESRRSVLEEEQNGGKKE